MAVGAEMVMERPQLPAPRPGLYVRHREERGFTAHVTASETTFPAVRRLAGWVLISYGVDREVADTVELVVSELVGNAVRVCGPSVPVVVEVYLTGGGVAVRVHDPEPEMLPRRSRRPMDSDQAVSGRGLALLDVLAPGWKVACSPVGKKICCLVPCS
ncbi:ATP-binding protein [Streptomyces sp. URMC 123]|uniref:ATP-binding protein n=1 Tax=Streptomyces sp. URMC 123 TaxID=3423403 RepID=UPI003F1CED99